MDVLLIDDKCVLCNKTAAFIVKHGGGDKFIFLSLFSDEGRKMLRENGLPENYDKSVVLIKNNIAYTKSTAILKLFKKLDGWLPVLYIFTVIPKPIRDWVYTLTAKHRHKIFKI